MTDTTHEAQYIVDEQGNRKSVVLPIEEYERLVEAAEELFHRAAHNEAMDARARGDWETIPWEQAKRELREGRVPEEG